jgi:hypothetical protein
VVAQEPASRGGETKGVTMGVKPHGNTGVHLLES